MGFFSRSSSLRSNSNHNSAECTGDSSALVTLLQAKIAQLEDQLGEKESVIGDLQNGLEGHLKCLNKLKLDSSASSASSRTLETSSSMSGSSCFLVPHGTHGNDQDNDSTSDHNDPFEENLVVSRLSNQLEDKNCEMASLQVQLEEQRLLSSHLQEKLQASDQGKATLRQTVQSLEKKIFDQANQIECLQALNETNTSIVSEMDLVQTHQHQHQHHSPTSSSSSNSPNQWKMYQKLQSLMATNNKMAHQVSTLTQSKQAALKKVDSLQKEQGNLCDQIDALTKELQEKDHLISQLQLERTDCDLVEDSAINLDLSNKSHVLPEIQQVLDIFPCNSTDTDESQEDPKLLQLSLQVCQSQLKQIQRDHELQLQKTVRQSVQLAESRANVDTLTAKVEHYETLMDTLIQQNTGTPAAAANPHSKAVRNLMMIANKHSSAPNLIAAAPQVQCNSPPPMMMMDVGFHWTSPPTQQQTISYTRNTLRRLSLPKFMTNRAKQVPQQQQNIHKDTNLMNPNVHTDC